MPGKIIPSVLMKHAPKIIKRVPNSRQILKGVYHDVDGSITVTDSHYLWRVENAHNYPSPMIIDPMNMQPIDGNYPETKHLFPDPVNEKGCWNIVLDNYTIGMLKALRECGKYLVGDRIKKKEEVIFKIQGDTLSTYESSVNARLEFTGFDNHDALVYINATHLINTLEWLKDELGESKTIPAYYYGANLPILLYHERAKALIQPIRVN